MTSIIINDNIFHLILKFLVLPLEKWIYITVEKEELLGIHDHVSFNVIGFNTSEMCSTLCPSHHSRRLTLPAIFLIWIRSLQNFCFIMHLKRRIYFHEFYIGLFDFNFIPLYIIQVKWYHVEYDLFVIFLFIFNLYLSKWGYMIQGNDSFYFKGNLNKNNNIRILWL